MTVEQTAAAEAAKEKKKARPALQYGDQTALAKPKLTEHLPSPVRGGGTAGGGAADIKMAFIEIEKHRDKWFLVAENIPNAGRFYDGFRSQGALVKAQRRENTLTVKTRTGADEVVPAFDIYACVPAGPINKWLKGKKKKEAAEAAAAEAAAAAENAPRQGRGQ